MHNPPPPFTPPNAIIAGVMAFVPLLSLIIWVFIFFSFFLSLANDMERDYNYNITDENIDRYLISMFLGIAIVGLLNLGGLIYYIVIISKNSTLTSDMRLVWILLAVFGGVLANLVYYFMYVIPQSRGQQPLG
jgi:hypothetical protein